MPFGGAVSSWAPVWHSAEEQDFIEFERAFSSTFERRIGPQPQRLIQRWIQFHVPTAQIEQINILATSVLEDADKAVQWLSQPNPATDDRAPIELIGEPQGFERVKNLLLRIEYGVLA